MRVPGRAEGAGNDQGTRAVSDGAAPKPVPGWGGWAAKTESISVRPDR